MGIGTGLFTILKLMLTRCHRVQMHPYAQEMIDVCVFFILTQGVSATLYAIPPFPDLSVHHQWRSALAVLRRID